MDLQAIDAVVFDLGGVVLNIDYGKTEEAFVQLGLADFGEAYSQLCQTELFDRFETGHISVFHFINRLLDKLPRGCNGNQVVHAWNAMILDFPVKRLEMIASLRPRFKTFLLSNTNFIHMDEVRRKLAKCGTGKELEDYFDKVYLSCEMGMRKPDPEIFRTVCREQQLEPSRTLFIDDSPQHIEGAKTAGLQTHFVSPGTVIDGLFS
jgi:glucose-1-phosphatase